MWKRRLHYIWRSPEASIALFDQLRFTMIEILRQLDTKSWEKAGIFPDGERITVGELLIRGANHAEEHARREMWQGFSVGIAATGDDPGSRQARCRSFRQLVDVLQDFELHERAAATRYLMLEGLTRYGGEL